MADGSGRWGRGLTDVGRRGAPRAASAGRRIVSPRPVLQVVAGVGAVDGGRAADARRGERGGRARRATQGGQGRRDTIGEAGCVIGWGIYGFFVGLLDSWAILGEYRHCSVLFG
jgi:hypothetical protein